jgi:ferredoxin
MAKMMAQAYEIKIINDGEERYRFNCRPDEPLLNGIRRVFCKEIPRGCSGGGCGVCKVLIRHGRVLPFKPMSREHITNEEILKDVVLACCVKPRSNMEISFYH